LSLAGQIWIDYWKYTLNGTVSNPPTLFQQLMAVANCVLITVFIKGGIHENLKKRDGKDDKS